MTLLSPGGEGVAHAHTLPAIPHEAFPVTNRAGVVVGTPQRLPVVNAVAACSCGMRFTTRLVADGYVRSVQWVRLRWWHRKAHHRLREATR